MALKSARRPDQIDSQTQKTRVFLSYSRKDDRFAENLRDQLIEHSFDAYLDKHDILPGEPWQERLGGLIAAADTILFCVSPHSVASEVVDWEVNRAEELNKRIIPVVVTDTDTNSVPERLRRLNYIFLRNETEYEGDFSKLTESLERDIAWIREHTRIGELAERWLVNKKPPDQYLRGVELTSVEIWAQNRPQNAPVLTETMLEFIKHSRLGEIAAKRQRRRMWVVVGTLAILSVIVSIGWWKQDFLKERIHWNLAMGPEVLLPEAERLKAGQPGATFKECKNGCPEMVVIPAGSFMMGSSPAENYPRELPQHKVKIEIPFAVAKFELTFEEWDHCANYGNCNPDISASGWGRGRQPVVNVTWQEAQTYVKWLSKLTGQDYRLLSEAEWEYSARGGKQEFFSFGNDNVFLKDYGWYADNSDGRAHPVNLKLPNSFGLQDMHGNVSEWVADCSNDNYRNAPEDGSPWLTGNCDGRVFRGGSWLYGPRVLRSAHRDWLIDDVKKDHVGFRVARTLVPN